MTYTARALTGIMIMGEALGVGTPQGQGDALAGILTGRYDEELKCAIHVRDFGSIESPEDLEKPEVQVMLERVKSHIRHRVQMIFELAAEEDRREQQSNLDRLRAQLAESSKPHEMGTVAEIAAKYGVSKSEVRRLKAAGELHTLKEKNV